MSDYKGAALMIDALPTAKALLADNPKLKWTVPTDGGMIWTDNMLIPKGGDAFTASTFMNFVYDPKIAAQIEAYVNYICPVEGAREEMLKIDKEIAALTNSDIAITCTVRLTDTTDWGSGFVGALSGNVTGQSYQVVASWLSPTKLGIGQLQPNVRFQGFDEDAGDSKIIDVGLGYIVDGFNHLYRVNYRHAKNPTGSAGDEDSIQIGAQLQL